MNAPSPIPAAAVRRYAVEASFNAAEVQAQWAELEPHGSPFQTRAWLTPWLRLVGSNFGAAPIYLTVRDAGDGRALMFFPLCRRRWRGLTTIEFPDLGLSDYNAPLISPQFIPTADQWRGLWREIVGALPPADLLRLDKVPATLGGRDNPLARLDGMRRMALSAWELSLPATRDDYERRLDRKTRKEHRRKRKNLTERAGEIALQRAATPAEAEAILAALRSGREARLARTGRRDELNHPCFFAFYRAVALDGLADFVDLMALKAGDRILATLYALRHDGACLLLMQAFDPALAALSPGIVAINALIDRLIDAGQRCLDFTIGDEAYKREFAVRETAMMSGVFPLSLLGHFYVAARSLARRGVRATAAPTGASRPRET